MSFHAGQTFTFGEQPSATKWQYVWDNDYALADGTAIANDAILARHVKDGDILPYHLISSLSALTSWAMQSYTTTVTGWSSTTIKTSKWCQIGEIVIIIVNISGTSNSTAASMTLPVASKTGTNVYYEGMLASTVDNGANPTIPGKMFVDPSSNASLASFYKDVTGAVWTASGTKAVRGTLIYEAA